MTPRVRHRVTSIDDGVSIVNECENDDNTIKSIIPVTVHTIKQLVYAESVLTESFIGAFFYLVHCAFHHWSRGGCFTFIHYR